MMELEDAIKSPSMPQQYSTVMCVICSAFAGIGIGFFGCLLSSADHLRSANGGKHSRASSRRHILGVIGSSVFGIFSLVGLFFGSMSLATVVRAGSTLPANAFFSQAFGLRPIVRDDVLGTFVTVSGVVCFSLFKGAGSYDHSVDAYLDLVASVRSLCWLAVLLLTLASAVGWIFLHRADYRRKENHLRAISTAAVSACASAMMDLATKAWSAVLKHEFDSLLTSGLFWSAVILNVGFMVVMRWSTIYGCRRCDVLVFVPMNSIGNILCSVATGMICLKESSEVTSWPGLLFSASSILCGIIMLVSGPADTSMSLHDVSSKTSSRKTTSGKSHKHGTDEDEESTSAESDPGLPLPVTTNISIAGRRGRESKAAGGSGTGAGTGGGSGTATVGGGGGGGGRGGGATGAAREEGEEAAGCIQPSSAALTPGAGAAASCTIDCAQGGHSADAYDASCAACVGAGALSATSAGAVVDGVRSSDELEALARGLPYTATQRGGDMTTATPSRTSFTTESSSVYDDADGYSYGYSYGYCEGEGEGEGEGEKDPTPHYVTGMTSHMGMITRLNEEHSRSAGRRSEQALLHKLPSRPSCFRASLGPKRTVPLPLEFESGSAGGRANNMVNVNSAPARGSSGLRSGGGGASASNGSCSGGGQLTSRRSEASELQA